jgi:hypothetical protein
MPSIHYWVILYFYKIIELIELIIYVIHNLVNFPIFMYDLKVNKLSYLNN